MAACFPGVATGWREKMKTDDFFQLCIAGTHSGVGKTTLTLGILASLKRRGYAVQPFKCGPDYIDPGHHTRASGCQSRNLDTWMMGKNAVVESYAKSCRFVDGAVVEGVMGLFDGASSTSLVGSSAQVAKILDLPVLLVVNARSMARSLAALVKGFATFEPGVNIVGVIANQTGSKRHVSILEESLAAADLPPLLGALPKDASWAIPERHLGLVTGFEHEESLSWYERLADAVDTHLEVEKLIALCWGPRPWWQEVQKPIQRPQSVRVAIARDAAFHFYYQDNLDRLAAAGIELIPFSPLKDQYLPEKISGIYIGGGFPEMFARQLEANRSLKAEVAAFADRGGCIYAECGGFMYLCRTLVDRDGCRREMCGVIPAETMMESRLHRLGYVEARTTSSGLFGPAGTMYRGHEFHWSSIVVDGSAQQAVEIKKPGEFSRHPEGFRLKNVWGTYVHAHFASNPEIPANWSSFLLSQF